MQKNGGRKGTKRNAPLPAKGNVVGKNENKGFKYENMSSKNAGFVADEKDDEFSSY